MKKILKQRRYITIYFVIVIAIVLRFYQLGDVPVGLHRDEAFLGYNAYSLLKTGMDMTGHVFPLHFESFLHSPAGYAYASLPFIALFDLSAFSVRFASALFGVISVGIIYLLVRELFYKQKERHVIALLTSLLFALVPWHLNLSRTATESVLVLCLFLLGLWLYLLAVRVKKSWLVVLSVLSFSVTLTLYQSPRAFLPLFLPLLFILYPLKKKKDVVIVLLSYMMLIVLPVILILTHPTLSTRIRTVSIFSTEETQLVIAEQLREDGIKGISAFVARVFHNKAEAYTEVIQKNFFAHLSYPFLFTDQGMPDRYRVAGTGLLYVIMLPFILLGGYLLAQYERCVFYLLLVWLMTGLFGSALTFDDIPNLQRTVTVLPVFLIPTSYAVYSLIFRKHALNKWVRRGFIMCFLLGITWETTQYVHNYYIQQVVHRPWRRHEGYEEVVSKVQHVLPLYNKAIITNNESAPAIFFLFYNKYDPRTYIDQIKNSQLRDFDRVNFGPYEFIEKECPSIITEHPNPEGTVYECSTESAVYVESFSCLVPPPCGELQEEIRRSDGTKVFQIVIPKKPVTQEEK
jgi:4-amino-4-deoxy-L-arabinose transferase-like glycosyltransferase